MIFPLKTPPVFNLQASTLPVHPHSSRKTLENHALVFNNDGFWDRLQKRNRLSGQPAIW